MYGLCALIAAWLSASQRRSQVDVGMNRSSRGCSVKLKCFKRSNGLDTMLYYQSTHFNELRRYVRLFNRVGVLGY